MGFFHFHNIAAIVSTRTLRRSRAYGFVNAVGASPANCHQARLYFCPDSSPRLHSRIFAVLWKIADTATIPTAQQSTITNLYTALFNRAPDANGLAMDATKSLTVTAGVGGSSVRGGSGGDAITLAATGTGVDTIGYFNASVSKQDFVNAAGTALGKQDEIVNFKSGTDKISLGLSSRRPNRC